MRGQTFNRDEGQTISPFSRICAYVFAFVLLLCGVGAAQSEIAAAACPPDANEIVCENEKTGNPPSEWDVEGAGDQSIQGFATEISVDRGQTVRFKVDTASTAYHLEIYRMGYYDGAGARLVDEVQPSVPLPQDQPPCETEDPDETGLVDCGTWHESASWPVPADAVSGIYFAKLVRDDKPASEGSHVIFVVRDDGSDSDLLFQTSDTTWQAYNSYGGNSLYEGGPGNNPNRAYKVSYNRPLSTRETTPEDAPFSAEYPMVRWLERNGYDVSYSTGIDTDRRGAELLGHKVFLSVGHDEYWSGAQRANVEAAREAGVNLTFFSGNEIFWKTRWESSIDGSGAPYRTLVSYKETHANDKIDPEANVWTGTWRDPRFSPPADGGRPENALSGTIFTVDAGTGPIEVPAAYGKMRLWRDTSVAELEPGETATLAEGTLGYEWDEDLDNGARPPGLADLSATTMEVPQKLLDYGSNYAPGTATHHLTLYRAPSGALVFGAGTVQWSWGLDGEHDRDGSTADRRMQQATTNLFADMGVQPGTRQADLAAATQTTDADPPVTTISTPGDSAQLETGQPVTISGTASDTTGETAGGQVAAVEVSTDGGNRWHPAQGRDHWSYRWTPGNAGSAEILARAVDDSANLDQTGDEVAVEVVPHSCPCSIWDEAFTAPEETDPDAVEVGVKFRADTPGFITGLRFYKTIGNTGTHIGRLWTASGTELAEATFSDESASGWQQLSFDGPVPIEAGTTYVASYHAPNGHYAAIDGYFSLVGADNAPLHALADGVDGGNGIFNYGHSGGLYSGDGPRTYGATNYLVDVVFQEEAGDDTTAPKISAFAPAQGAVDVNTKSAARVIFSEAMAPSSLDGDSVKLEDGAGAPVAATISYSAVERRLSIDPTAELQNSSSYRVTIKGGPGGATDAAGNPLTGDTTWSFRTGAPPPAPPDQGSGGPILLISNAANPFSQYYAEILRSEGLNGFSSTDVSALSPALLDAHDVAILGEGSLGAAQAQMLNDWVERGGNLIAMRPGPQLAGLLGLSAAGGTLANAYLKVDTGSEAGAGIVDQTMQFHGTADRYTASDAEAIATLYSDASTATASPAVTLRAVGSKGGQAAAFTYDLARSVVYTRQGNPAWAGEDRDEEGPVRSDDLFFGAKKGDEQPDWVDLSKVAIPQADEQQRLLTNLIERMNVDRKPIPRFWFLPRDEKAAVVMTGDDHARGGTAGRFDGYEAASPPGCVVADWECIRATSYVFPNTPLDDGELAGYTAAGFEVGLHTLTNCENWRDRAELESLYSPQLEALNGAFPSLPAPTTNRTHCIVWSDWATQPKVERQNGIRLDTTYYYWPGSWVKDRPGMFTGSGMPMRFADLDGSLIDVYQAATQMTDESEQTYPFTVDTLLDNAVGPNGYYGVFTANMHTDEVGSPDSDAVVASALAHDVPVVSAKQMLTWLDGRNRSSFGGIDWKGHRLSFTIDPASGSNGLRAMLPISSSAGDLVSIERTGTPVATTTRTIKGIEYAFFDASAGAYSAVYEVPELSATVPASPASSNAPAIVGSAPAGTTIRIYAGADCSGTPVATGSDAQLATGIAVSVPADSTTDFRATATSAANRTSPCSQPLTYEEDSSAPETQVDLGPDDPTGSASAEFGFSGSDGVGSGIVGFECRLDAASFAPCSSPQTYGPLADGPHAFQVRAVDTAGNVDASPSSYGWTVDTTAPTVTIDSLSTGLVGANGSTEVHWRAGENGSFALRVGGTDCAGGTVVDSGSYSDQPAVHTSTVTSAQLAEGANTLRLCLADAAANSGQASVAVSRDTTAPDTQIGSRPADLSSSTDAEFTFTGADSGGSGVASFQCRLDSSSEAAWTGCGSPQSFAALPDGAHTFEVRAIDQAANVDAVAASFAWSVDTTAPAVTVDSLSKALLGMGESSEIHFHGDEDGAFELRLGGADCASGTILDSGGYSGHPADDIATVAATQLAEGANGLRLCLRDGAANAGAATATLSKDTSAPETQIGANPDDPSGLASAEFGFSGADTGGSGVASFQCRLDGSIFAPCASPQPYSSLDDGSHQFEVRAIDAAGNADASPAAFTWVVDTTPPVVAIDSGPSGLTNDAAPTFEFHAAEDGVGFECSIDGGSASFAPCSAAAAHTPGAPLGDGPHTFRVRVSDAAGNQATNSRDFTVDTAIPPAPSLDTTVPAGPANDNAPVLVGSAAASSTVRLYTGADCGSVPIATGSAAELAAGIGVTVADDSTTDFRATATSPADNTSPCSAPISYREDSTAPETQIDSGPTGITSADGASISFSSEPGASFECRLDSSDPDDWASCGSPVTLTALGNGTHGFEVRAVDAAANTDASPAVRTWTVDTTAPAVTIDSLSKALLGVGESSEIRWHGSENGNFSLRVGGVDCSTGTVVDSGVYSEQPAEHTSAVDVAQLAEGANALRLCVTDEAASTGSAITTLSKDTTAPDTQIGAKPVDPSSSNDAEFGFSGNDGAGSGVTAFECRLDSGEPSEWGACVSPRALSALGDGSHVFEVRAVDAVGNVDLTPASYGWSVDTVIPSAPSLDATVPAGPANHNSPGVKGTAAPGSTVRLYTGADCSGAPVATGSAAELAAGIGVTVADDSTTDFRATATSPAGNTSPCSAPISYREDSTAPVTQIDSGPTGTTSADGASIAFSSEPGAAFECRLDPTDPVDWASCSSPAVLSSLGNGPHSFEVRAVDAAGNTDATPAVRTWSVDTTAPEVTIDSLSKTLLGVGESSEIRWHGSENGNFALRLGADCSTGMVLDSGAYSDQPAVHVSTVDVDDLAEGTDTLSLCLTDEAASTGSAIATLSKDTTAPDTQIGIKPSDPSASANAEFAFSGDDGVGSGVTAFECRLDAEPFTPCGPSPQTYGQLGDGSHSFEVLAIDAAGNADASPASYEWTIDTVVPPPNLTAAVPASPANDNSPQIEGSAAAGSTVRLYTSADCSGTPVATGSATRLAAGIGVTVTDDSTTDFRATATSVAGTTSLCSAPLTYVEDSTAPETQIDSGPSGTTSATSASFGFSSEAGASFQCRLDSDIADDWTSCGSPQLTSALSDGFHSFEVRATDAAGNIDASPAGRTWTVDTAVSPGEEDDSGGDEPKAGGGPAPPIVDPPPGSSLGPVRLLGARYNARRGVVTLQLEVPSPGRLSVRNPEELLGKKLRKLGSASATQGRRTPRQIRSTFVLAPHGGRVKLAVKLTPAAQKLLSENAKLRLRMELTFEPYGGSKVTKTATVVLKRKAPASP